MYPPAASKVVSVGPYESVLFVGETMKCTFVGSIFELGRGRPSDSYSRAILGDSSNIVLGIAFVET